MRRGYTRQEYLSRIHALQQRRSGISLSTDIIVGFPGETDAEFDQTLELLEHMEYDEIFSFMYSPRPQTVSAKLYEDDIHDEVKKDRLLRVQRVQQAISLKHNRQKIGTVEEVLVDGTSKLKNGQVMGRTRTNRIVNLKGPETLIGEFVSVRITGATANSLIGELLPASRPSGYEFEREFA
jgi:tRNA-2-methylthio-N6-dimethylallyladenosine synthase